MKNDKTKLHFDYVSFPELKKIFMNHFGLIER